MLLQQWADQFGSAPALIDEHDTLSYRGLAERASRYARWAIAERIQPGTTVCLLLNNCVDYLALWLGLTRAGLTVALLNTHLRGQLLAHAIDTVQPGHLIAGAAFLEPLEAIRAQLGPRTQCWGYRGAHPAFADVDQAIEGLSADPITAGERAAPTLSDPALYIFTSGTTGLPKAAVVTHLRLVRWAQWFSGMMDMTPADRMYDCLPLYHSVGGIVAPGATLAAGGAVVLREKFSARRFWQDVHETRCTVFQYIGELCRFLLAQPEGSLERAHALRLACGNGLQGPFWKPLQERFGIGQILEYYASTEGNVSLYNCEGEAGSVGRIPPFLSHRYPVAIVRSDPDTGEPVRDPIGRCVPCTSGQSGEVLGQILDDPAHSAMRFEGYTDAAASSRKVLRDVFTPGDAWFRTGDLMRRDNRGFFYFVDRIGDTFRWRGENVSSTEVSRVIESCSGVIDTAVYGVRVPGAEGRAGMAALVVDAAFDLATFRTECAQQLPSYARPVFLRIVSTLQRTGTFKLQKGALAADGYDPRRSTDPLYIDSPAQHRYIPLDPEQFEAVCSGQTKL